MSRRLRQTASCCGNRRTLNPFFPCTFFFFFFPFSVCCLYRQWLSTIPYDTTHGNMYEFNQPWCRHIATLPPTTSPCFAALSDPRPDPVLCVEAHATADTDEKASGIRKKSTRQVKPSNTRTYISLVGMSSLMLLVADFRCDVLVCPTCVI